MMWMLLLNLAEWGLRPWLTNESLDRPWGQENWAWRLLRWLMYRAMPEVHRGH